MRTFSRSDSRPWCRNWVVNGREQESGSKAMCSSLPRPTSRACAWPGELGEHLLHELPAARPVCLPRLHPVAGRVHHAVHGGSEGAPPTPVFILDPVAPPERYLAGH